MFGTGTPTSVTLSNLLFPEIPDAFVPAKSILTLKLGLLFTPLIALKSKVTRELVGSKEGLNEVEMNLEELTDGLYFMTVESYKKKEVSKVIVKH